MSDDGAFSSFSTTARRRLPALFADYLDGGAHGERTMARNRKTFKRWGIVPRGLRDVSSINLSTQCFGKPWDLPLFLAPLGFAGMLHADGETGAARAALARNIGMGISTFSIAPMETVAATGARTMAQIYVMRDRSITLDMLERARSCGISDIILTIDTAITPVRERDARNGFRHLSRPTIRQLAGLMKHPRWLAGMHHRHMHKVGNIERYTASRGVMAQARDIASQIDPSLSWDDLAWLRAHWKGTLVVKGVMHPDDAYQIAEACADGIIVSNHGGRQMDPAPSALDVLPAIADRLAGRLDIVIDGGIRRGSDVVTALLLGATAVSIGRPWGWALTAGGTAGVGAALDTLAQEIRDVMALAGLCDMKELHTTGKRALWQF